MLLYESLANELDAWIADGRLRAGERLPSVRALARQRSVSISTVVQALRVLEARGSIEARPQSGHYVRGGPRGVTDPPALVAMPAPVQVGVSRRVMAVLEANETRGTVPFGAALPAAALLPTTRLMRQYGAQARAQPGMLAGSSHLGLGEPELLRAIVRRSLDWSDAIDPAEIVVTNSCTESIALCLRAVTQPGDTVAVESPTYYLMLQLLELMGLRAIEIPTHPRDGVSLEALDFATRHQRIAACLFSANGTNPLGAIVPDARKRAIVALLAERDVPLIEDDIYGDLCFGGARPRPFHAFDGEGNTMLCTSWSKTVGPALRVGYVAGGRRAAALALQKTLTSGKTNPLTQRVVAALLTGRGHDAHLRRLRQSLQDQIDRTREAVLRHFPAGTVASEPGGGLSLWITLPGQPDTAALHERAIARGVAFVPGALFSASGAWGNCLRLSCGHPWTRRHEEAVKTLADLVTRDLDRARPQRTSQPAHAAIGAA